MADPAPKPPPAPAAPPASGAAAGAGSVLRMMGLPNLPKKLPSRNWMIFWALVGSFSGAIIYDKREKKRATARWAHAVSHLSREPLTSSNQLPRRLTVFLECPPGDGLRSSQDHFVEYVKPILSASGLDWDFVQGRREGDVRAAVAERIRRQHRGAARSDAEDVPLTADEIVRDVRHRNHTPEWQGVQGDIVIGRHTWKEYVRGLHEGWLGPLTAPPLPDPVPVTAPAAPTDQDPTKSEEEGEKKKEEEDKDKPKRPPQPRPHNSPDDYANASLPPAIPGTFSPSAPIAHPHILGFFNTFIRLGRFLNRRKLADDIGRDVAAVCLAASARQYQEERAVGEDASEVQGALAHEERDWPKTVWKDAAKAAEAEAGESKSDGSEKQPEQEEAPAERIWTQPVVTDPRITGRMRRFEMAPQDEERARQIQVPEEQVEGWLKGSARAVYRWAVAPREPNPCYSNE